MVQDSQIRMKKNRFSSLLPRCSRLSLPGCITLKPPYVSIKITRYVPIGRLLCHELNFLQVDMKL